MATHGVLTHRYCGVVIFLALFLVTSAQTRPQESREDSAESAEWQQTDREWTPTSDKDKWRAFEPSPEISTTRWWEQKLDDHLWDPRPEQEVETQEEKGEKAPVKVEVTPQSDQVNTIRSDVTKKPAVIVTDKANVVATDKQTPTTSAAEVVTEKQEAASTSPKSSSNDQADAADPTAAKSSADDTGYSAGFYRKAELNTFVESDPGTYYGSSDSLSSKSWDSGYSSSDESSESREVIPKSSSEQKSDPVSEPEKVDENKTPEPKQSITETTTKVAPENPAKDIAQPTLPVSENNMQTSKEVTPDKVNKSAEAAKTPEPAAEPVADDSNSIYGKGESIGAPALGSLNRDADKAAPVLTTQKPTEKPVKNAQDDFVDWADWDNSLFDGYQDDEEDTEELKSDNTVQENKEEIKKVVETKMVEEKKVTKESEEIKEKAKQEEVKISEIKKIAPVKNVENKSIPSANSDEEKKAPDVKNVEIKSIPALKNEDKKIPAVEGKMASAVEDKKIPAVKNSTLEETDLEEPEDFGDDDDVDDEYYDDWEDDWDEDIKLEGEMKESLAGTTTTSATSKSTKEKKTKKVKSAQKPKQAAVLDTAAQQASDLTAKVDKSHYSKGVIYDSDFPNHKPSVKKDLSNPADNMEQIQTAEKLAVDTNTDKSEHAEAAENLAMDSNVDKKVDIQSSLRKSVVSPSEKKDVVKLQSSKNVKESKAEPPKEISKEAGHSEEDTGSYQKEGRNDYTIPNKEATRAESDKADNSELKGDSAEQHLSKESESKEIKKEPSPSAKSALDSSAAEPALLKKEPSVTFFHASQMNTESDASTSPNPPPPGLATDKGSLTGGSANTTPGPNGQEQKKEDQTDDLIISYPIEFCQLDYECRAGRTCVKGVCKCVAPSTCAGHHKPICGSDGVRYASHCEMHRTACVNRVHIRVDRRGICFQKELNSQIAKKEKGWLLEQKSASQSVHIPSQEIYNFPEDIKKGPETSDVKKAFSPNDKEKQVKKATPAPIKKDCTWEEMAQFKEALLMYYCQKFVEPNCKVEVKTDRAYLSMLMFSYYDQNFDYFLTASELDDKEREEHFAKNIIVSCHLHDFVKFADTDDSNGKLTVSEFTQAFEISVPAATVRSKLEVISTLASAGNGLELKCGVEGATNVIWKRYGSQLADDKHSHQLMVFDDGALFFSKVGLHHIGNYSCVDADDETNLQVHRLRVQTLPVLTVNPVTQTDLAGTDVELKCHAEGVPKPVVTWKQGGEVINSSRHVTQYFGGGHIVIHNPQVETDSGTFTCSAHSQAGTTEKAVSVSVVPPTDKSYKSNIKEAGTFVVFNSHGIQAYNPMHCLMRHQVKGDFGSFKFIPDALDGPLTLCRSGQDCEWGSAVRVGSEFIYASQPDQNRVVIVATENSWNPIQVIDTDKKPMKLWYVKHLDQVWVLCANQEDPQGGKTIVVIRDASQNIQHRAVHTRPVGNHFDTVQDLFIAKPNDLEHEFDFGYVTHRDQNGLFKLNLEDMSYTKSVDLSSYGCLPTVIDFVPIGGHVVIQCVSAKDHHTLQLTMDYLTDTVISTVSLSGRPMTSPDSRHMVTVDESTGKVTVTSISDEGIMETTYEVTVSARISDVAFVPANSHHGYDLVLTSADDDDVILMNLVTGKVEKITGTQFTDPTAARRTSSIHRLIVPSNTMSNYLMTPSKSALAILDIKFKIVECEFVDTVGSSVMLYVPSSKTS